MSRSRLLPWLIGSVLLILIAGSAGWAIGAGSANGRNDAKAAREAGFQRGYDLVFERIDRMTSRRGFVAGSKRGKRAGATTGSREGARIGGGNVRIEEAVASEESAASAASSAQAEITAREANCGIVAAAPSWCPTSDELAGYRAAVKAVKEADAAAARQAEKDKQKGDQGGPPQ